MKKIVLHTCCGPCASACVPRLKTDRHEIVLYFANSNLDSFEEYEKRLAAARTLAAAEDCEIVAEPYNHDEWLKEVAAGFETAPEKGARCARCFAYNLKKASAYAKAAGIDKYTTSLTVSPHKPSQTVFAAAPDSNFIPYDFKKCGGYLSSVRRSEALGLYRQWFCGCEFSKWRIHHSAETLSTNLDARGRRPYEVFSADYQIAGRGRLDHKWISPPGLNLMMSAVLSVKDLTPDHVSTLPLAVGLAVCRAVGSVELKWPNDVLSLGRKLAGILCERDGDNVIVGIGVNVKEQIFPAEISAKATYLGGDRTVFEIRSAILVELDRIYMRWQRDGFAAIYPELQKVDFLKGKMLSVRQTDDDASPIRGLCSGIQSDGSLKVGEIFVFAGEAHVETLA